MDVINITAARQNLYQLVNQINETHRPVHILGKANDAVLLSAEDWRSIEETLYLQSIPGMTEIILDGLNTPIEDCINADDLEW